MERVSGHLARLLNEREFENEEEAEAFLQELTGGEIIAPARTPLQQAQDVMYDAWEATSRKQRVTMARKALVICPDCADAYVVLAEETVRTPEEARDLYAQGVAAAERALGEAFKEYEGSFWGFVETRPYMRAREGLAQCLWLLEEHEAAIDHFSEMLRLNPNDNQGIRYILAACLLELGRNRELVDLLDRYEEDCSAAWAYSRVLAVLCREGASPKAAQQLDAALEINPFVPPLLLGDRPLPDRLPDHIGFGDENEAAHYVAEFGMGWLKTPEALGWLRSMLEQR